MIKVTTIATQKMSRATIPDSDLRKDHISLFTNRNIRG